MQTTGGMTETANQTIVSAAVFALVIYIAVHTFESPIRYVLPLVGGSQLILARDALIILPLGVMISWDTLHQKIQVITLVALLQLPIAFTVGIINFGRLAPPALGLKMFFNVVLGVRVGTSLIDPPPWLFRLFVVFGAMTLFGVVLEK